VAKETLILQLMVRHSASGGRVNGQGLFVFREIFTDSHCYEAG
jgi:hypothetical protein